MIYPFTVPARLACVSLFPPRDDGVLHTNQTASHPLSPLQSLRVSLFPPRDPKDTARGRSGGGSGFLGGMVSYLFTSSPATSETYGPEVSRGGILVGVGGILGNRGWRMGVTVADKANP
jgi:hypothetical protein